MAQKKRNKFKGLRLINTGRERGRHPTIISNILFLDRKISKEFQNKKE